MKKKNKTEYSFERSNVRILRYTHLTRYLLQAFTLNTKNGSNKCDIKRYTRTQTLFRLI